MSPQGSIEDWIVSQQRVEVMGRTVRFIMEIGLSRVTMEMKRKRKESFAHLENVT